MGFKLRFTNKEVTAWGGMGLMKRLLDHIDFDSVLQLAGLPQSGSKDSVGCDGLLAFGRFAGNDDASVSKYMK